MGQKIEDKSKIGNWVEGDTFAIKIENCEYEEYNGRYLILICTIVPEWESSRTNLTFRAKITKDDKIPKTSEELEKLEYIVTGITSYEERFCPFEGNKTILETIEERKKIPMFPDEYGYLYHYIFEIYIRKYYVPNTVKYIGNFIVLPPSEEYIPFFGNGITKMMWCGIHNLLKNHNRYN